MTMKLHTVNDELYKFTRLNARPENEFSISHQATVSKSSEEALGYFLRATMDEARLRYATIFSENLLDATDGSAATKLLKAVFRRERSGSITYITQRDHAAHTLNNYLLGWYFLSYCDRIKREVNRHLHIRSSAKYTACFESIWPLTSLLHDIGYLFEGAVDPFDTHTHIQQVRAAAESVEEFFEEDAWHEFGISSTHIRTLLCKMADLEPLTFPSYSMPAIANRLRNLGSLEKLEKAVRIRAGSAKSASLLGKLSPISSDAFDLWRLHYRRLGMKNMVSMVNYAEKAFVSLYTNGTSANQVRILDHGVCGGLLLLQWLTRFYRIHFGLRSNSRNDVEMNAAGIIKRITTKGGYDAWIWWAGAVWGSATCALHSLLEDRGLAKVGCATPPRLALEDDPITYLGILVDTIQEWDRYTISYKNTLSGHIPLQGHEVYLGHTNTKVILKYHYNHTHVRNKVIEALNRCLLNWDVYLKIL